MKLSFVTFGCRLNRAEAADLEAECLAAGHTSVTLADCPDVIVVRGCSVTAKAQHDCEKAIARLKVEHPAARIEIMGCLPGAGGGPRPRQSAALPFVRIPSALSRFHLKIQDGCSGRCAYCIVPQFRGKPRSIPLDEICARMSAALEAGFREIVLTGCNLALYRDAGRTLVDVVEELATFPKVSAEYRIRLGSIEPCLVGEELLNVMARHPNICRFLHLSVQSAAPTILKSMRRPYDAERLERFVTSAREKLGETLMLGADIITGFPGETEADFCQTRDFLMRQHFANLHVFPYSERPGTLAATYPNVIPNAIRQKRAMILRQLGRENRLAFARQFADRKVTCCVERDGHSGWSSEYLRCHLTGIFPRRSLVSGIATPQSDGTLRIEIGNRK